ncbi:glycine dehydrogenase [Amanita rubescens]|nr:glycine dehydrogenase [Amanita rubescens]
MVFLRCSSVVGRISTLSRPLRLSRGFASLRKPASLFSPLDTFPERHIGPDDAETSKMLSKLGYSSMEAFIGETVPQKIRVPASFLDNTAMPALSESQLHERAKALGALNKPHKNYIGMGYHAAVVPPVILRNVLENPLGTLPTPYQPEIAQGMSDMTMVMSLTSMDVANASLLDEATAAAEAMVMAFASTSQKKRIFIVDSGILPQTLAYPDVDGKIKDFSSLAQIVHSAGGLVAYIVLGNSGRFGVPPGYGGPQAAFFAVKDALKRKMPGRLIGRSRDASGNPAYRLALQTREQHIRREKATSNICTSQALLANMAAMYAIYHGRDGLSRIANKVHGFAQVFKNLVERFGYKAENDHFFDTMLRLSMLLLLLQALTCVGLTRNALASRSTKVSLLETCYRSLMAFASAASKPTLSVADLEPVESQAIPEGLRRTSDFLPHPVFNKHHSETEMLRYIFHLSSKDVGLVHSMIPLGSCTMKLNSTSSMIPVQGYSAIIKELENDLCKVTGFHAASLQPNSGAAGEYAGLCVIRAYHESRSESHRDICLIPLSAHGTNPASAVMAGLKVVAVKVNSDGTLDLNDLRAKAEKHKNNLAAFMITYPSTFGVFEDGVQEACKIIHDNGGQVYLDGANLNAQIGITNPEKCGGDVCHLNLHKTFSIPHGGGGPGVGPICVAEHLAPFLPTHPHLSFKNGTAIDAISAAPFGSASIHLISWAYIRMLGGKGLSDSSKIALLNANYMAARLSGHYSLRFKNENGRVAHELLIDLAEFDKAAGLKVADFAKRLQFPFCDAMVQIRKEAQEIIDGKQPRENNVLKNAPHPMTTVAVADAQWNRPYSRQTAAYPLPWLLEKKMWPTVARVDDAFGDLNLVCDCPTVEEVASQID